MDLSAFTNLLTKEGQWALESAEAFSPIEKDFLADFQMLSKRFPREIARAALETAILRGEARKKFPQAEKMYFTREALEQASSWEISQVRAARFQGFSQVVDLGCSIGSDTLAFSTVTNAVGVEKDPLRIEMAKENAKALASSAVFIKSDITEQNFISQFDANSGLFIDPARRKDHRRVKNVEEYQPPLSIIKPWLVGNRAVGVKISPGVNLAQISQYDCEVEFISLKGELKEAVLWFGSLKSTQKRATLLPGGHTLTSADPAPEIPLNEPKQYIYEPDPAILRAGLVTTVGQQLNAAQLDSQIAYLTSDNLQSTPYARSWEIDSWMPFQLKRLRAKLREMDVGRVTVKKRGSPILPEDLIKDLRLTGKEKKILFLTQLLGKPIVIIANEIS